MAYFDNNATTQPLVGVLEAMHRGASENWANPSSPHRSGSRVRAGIEKAREEFAYSLKVDPRQITFTSGATESNNTILSFFSKRQSRDTNEILISNIEHASILEPAQFYFPGNVRFIQANSDGFVQVEKLEKLLDEKLPSLVALIAAHNETGILQPWREVAAICKDRGVWFHCDATQWMGKLDSEPLNICSSFSFSAHKFGGPKGMGGLVSCEPISLIKGGGQEKESRGGTENFPGILGMSVAWRDHFLNEPLVNKYEIWRNNFEDRLIKDFPNLKIIGRHLPRLWNTSLLCMPKFDNLSWVRKLDKLGYSVSTGSACSTAREEASSLSQAIGLSNDESHRLVRVSSYVGTTEKDWLGLGDAFMNANQELQTDYENTGLISL